MRRLLQPLTAEDDIGEDENGRVEKFGCELCACRSRNLHEVKRDVFGQSRNLREVEQELFEGEATVSRRTTMGKGSWAMKRDANRTLGRSCECPVIDHDVELGWKFLEAFGKVGCSFIITDMRIPHGEQSLMLCTDTRVDVWVVLDWRRNEVERRNVCEMQRLFVTCQS